MKKTFLKIILCFFLSLTNVVIDGFPTGLIYLKQYVCNLDIVEVLSKIEELTHLPTKKMEKQELNEIREFQNQHCNH